MKSSWPDAAYKRHTGLIEVTGLVLLLLAFFISAPGKPGPQAVISVLACESKDCAARSVVQPLFTFTVTKGEVPPKGVLLCKQETELHKHDGKDRVVVLDCEGGRKLELTYVDLSSR